MLGQQFDFRTIFLLLTVPSVIAAISLAMLARERRRQSFDAASAAMTVAE
jgi:AAHS family 4-hydroxybenzoate transporter-like MFS transporter